MNAIFKHARALTSGSGLADELGLLADLPKYRKGSGSFDPAAELERYRSLYETGQISADAYVKVCTPLAKMAK